MTLVLCVILVLLVLYEGARWALWMQELNDPWRKARCLNRWAVNFRPPCSVLGHTFTATNCCCWCDERTAGIRVDNQAMDMYIVKYGPKEEQEEAAKRARAYLEYAKRYRSRRPPPIRSGKARFQEAALRGTKKGYR